jgi:site-specific recombinase XerD
MPQLVGPAPDGRVTLGHPLVDGYLEVVQARCRPNTLLATAFDLKVFFTIVAMDPVEVTITDVLGFIRSQRGVQLGKVVQLADRPTGLALSTVRRRLSSVSGLFAHLLAVGVVAVNPVLRGAATSTPASRARRGAPLVRQVRQLPQVLTPQDVNALLGALRRWRDRAMIEAMVLGGLRRSEVLGLRLEDLRSPQRRVFIANGKGGHQRWVPISPRFFASVSEYLRRERPTDTATNRVFVVLKGPHRGQPLTAKGLEQIMRDARVRAGLTHGTCHELRHTCLTRLREAGMALEALQAQAGHRSIESTRLYLHLADDWLAGEYQRASELIDASVVGILR